MKMGTFAGIQPLREAWGAHGFTDVPEDADFPGDADAPWPMPFAPAVDVDFPGMRPPEAVPPRRPRSRQRRPPPVASSATPIEGSGRARPSVRCVRGSGVHPEPVGKAGR